MQTSELINEIGAALSKAQAEIEGAVKGTRNTFFNSNYADLGAVWDEIRAPVTKNNIAIIQSADALDAGIVIVTLLVHSSGQWIRSYTPPLTPKDRSPQAIGSCLTYGRRYGLAAAVGCPQVDDDGNAASAPTMKGRGKAPIHSPLGDAGKDVPPDVAIVLADQLREIKDPAEAFDFNAKANQDQETFLAAWRLLRSDERSAWKALVEKGKEQSK